MIKERLLSGIKYGKTEPILVAVDSILFGVRENGLNLLIFEREIDPFAGQWSLVGAFVGEQENVDDAATRVIHELTGLQNVYVDQLGCFGDASRDPGGRVISIAYWSLIKIDQTNDILKANHHRAKWVAFNQRPTLVLDHDRMVEEAIQHLREKARFHPIGFELLPREFTLSQLLHVYEAIYDEKLDDRNFRKKILHSDLLIDLGKKDMTTSKKGSYLYSFDQGRYNQLLQKGFNFDFNF
ncbi:MAG: NUDIX domain-containing protein [Bacteroidota bacterium]